MVDNSSAVQYVRIVAFFVLDKDISKVNGLQVFSIDSCETMFDTLLFDQMNKIIEE